MKMLPFVIWTAAILSTTVNGYIVCGNGTHRQVEVNEAITETVDRLMKLRSPNWDWIEPFIPAALQVAAPKRLFGREKTTAATIQEIANNWEFFGLLDYSNFAIIARSLCLDPRNISGNDLLEAVERELNRMPANESGVPPELESAYSFGLYSLCLNGYSINASLVDTLLIGQGQDGSFGPETDNVAGTIFMLASMFCLTRVENPAFNVTEVEEAVNKMRDFVKQQAYPTENGTFLGQSEIEANDALVALWKSKEPDEDPDTDWYCSEVIDTLGLTPYDGEDGYSMQFRLLRLTGASFLDLQDEDYECVATDPIPEGYKPTCDFNKPETCA